ncbi:MAG TPA: hypothetical protein VMV81_11695 [Phycisphaerae bacterium]|nr:hypothetical protein [Phycisphaerae bacterium]
MLTPDTLITIGFVALGGATYLKLLGSARVAAVSEAERRIAAESPPGSALPQFIPEVSGEDPE